MSYSEVHQGQRAHGGICNELMPDKPAHLEFILNTISRRYWSDESRYVGHMSLVFMQLDCTVCIVELIMNHNLKITKTRLYSFDPLNPRFYTVKLGFTGVFTM